MSEWRIYETSFKTTTFYNSFFFFFFPKIFQRLPDWFPFYDMDTTLALHLGCFEPEYQDSYWFQDFAPATANEKIMIYWLPCVFNYFAVWLFQRALIEKITPVNQWNRSILALIGLTNSTKNLTNNIKWTLKLSWFACGYFSYPLGHNKLTF